MMAPAFQFALPLSRVSHPPQHRRARGAVAACAVAPLRTRSVIALRGISDAAWCAMMHEVVIRALAGGAAASISTAAEPQLMLGGLVGIWTAAAVAARVRNQRAAAVRESAGLPAAWAEARDRAYADDVAAVAALDADDAAALIHWLAALDELEGPRAAAAVWALARSPVPHVRATLAAALAEHPARANAVAAALAALADDRDHDVRVSAQAAVAAHHEALFSSANSGALDVDIDARERLARLFADDVTPVRWAPVAAPRDHDTIAARFALALDVLGDAALRKRETTGVSNKASSEHRITKTTEKIRLKVPLFDSLKWSELHGLCTLAALPLAYELFALAGGADLPLRFVGLGWVLAVGGLAAYPQSAKLWFGIQKACEQDAAQYSS